MCNLASIALPSFVKNATFDFDAFEDSVRTVTRNLNKVIDRNTYAVREAEMSNMRHRPIGIGIQGLADVFAMLRFPFESAAAREMNRKIFEHLYYAALDASCSLAKQEGTYPSYRGSPISKGILQFDFWNCTERHAGDARWKSLRERIAQFGVRNSLLVAPMPTASTAQILGNQECFEPFTSNINSRRVLAGEFAVVNKHLVRELESHNLWTEDVRLAIIAAGGSVQNIPIIPDEVKELFKTVWETKMRSVIDMAAERAVYIDQSQSLNLFVDSPTHAKLTSTHFYAWKKGLKTGLLLAYETGFRGSEGDGSCGRVAAAKKNECDSVCEACSA